MDGPTLTSFFDELEKLSSGGEEVISIPKTKAEKWKAFKGGVKGEWKPALGATLGAGVAGAYGVNPLAGAAAGYGVGSIPDIVKGLLHRRELLRMGH